MIIDKTPLEDAMVIRPKLFEDERGYFFESFNQSTWEASEVPSYNWVQENESLSSRGVLRGLHFQKGKSSQAKLVRVIKGEVFDVAVDLRKSSKTYGQWFGTYLSDKNKKQMLVPRGFAHGFLVISETAIFSYKCDNYYSPQDDSGIIYNDETLNIEWPDIEMEYKLSEKDMNLGSFKTSYKF